jgi:hypothetical protein
MTGSVRSGRGSGTDGLRTLRWSGMDSNFRSRADRSSIELKPYRQRELLLTTDTESSRDPPLEGDSFEPLDLRQKLT